MLAMQDDVHVLNPDIFKQRSLVVVDQSLRAACANLLMCSNLTADPALLYCYGKGFAVSGGIVRTILGHGKVDGNIVSLSCTLAIERAGAGHYIDLITATDVVRGRRLREEHQLEFGGLEPNRASVYAVVIPAATFP
jgi:hypothetical protein